MVGDHLGQLLVVIFHVILTRTRWGLHTVAVGGNMLGAREAGIKVDRIKYGNFMMCSGFGALVGLRSAFKNNIIDPSAGQLQLMFYAVTGRSSAAPRCWAAPARSSARSSA